MYGGYHWYTGDLDAHLPKHLQVHEVLGDWAPAKTAPLPR
jgi:hypothetical protein